MVAGPVGPSRVDPQLPADGGRAEDGRHRVSVEVPGADVGARELATQVAGRRGRRGHAHALLAVGAAAADPTARAAVGVGREGGLASGGHVAVAVAIALVAGIDARVGHARRVAVGAHRAAAVAGRGGGRSRLRRCHAASRRARLAHGADRAAGAAVGVVELDVPARAVAEQQAGAAVHGHLDGAAEAAEADLPRRAHAAAGAAVVAVVGEVAAGAAAVGDARAAVELRGRGGHRRAGAGVGLRAGRGGGIHVTGEAASGGEREREDDVCELHDV